jgi:DNA-binding NarL/FixJ family response regulator
VKLATLSDHQWRQVARRLELSPRKLAIVKLVLCAMLDKQIAHALNLRPCTVRTHLRQLRHRLRIGTRVELVLAVFGALERMPHASSKMTNCRNRVSRLNSSSPRKG